MCGICGKIDLEGTPVERYVIDNMVNTLYHRGPDDSGIMIKGNVGLGHSRLSIIDLSKKGRQPIANENKTVWIVFNGEIYNFPELKRFLISKGHEFMSDTDTEVIVHLYEEYGMECLNHLRGMFAFAIFDEKKSLLFLARDRLGKKPLYYYFDNKVFIFASEIKAILQDRVIKKNPDLKAIHHYLTYQFVPSPFTAFKNIKKLPPAHFLTLKNKKIEIKRYWDINYYPKRNESYKVIREKLREGLEEAVKIRMISDVPLGVFLSGGIDSSIVVSLMSRLSDEPIKTFSVGFEDEEYNELEYARLVAERFNTEHREFIVKPEALEVLPKLVWHYNEPFADPSAIPTYYISKVAKDYVKVVLNGDGGDELFAGYDRYLISIIAKKIERFFPLFIVNVLLKVLKNVSHGGSRKNILWIIKRFIQGFELPSDVRQATWLFSFDNSSKRQLYTEDFYNIVYSDSLELMRGLFESNNAIDYLDRMLYCDLMLYLPDDLLTKVDVASMANSIEVRSPFLDHELVEYVARIPAGLKLKGITLKYLLKEVFKNELPEIIIKRKKMGFSVPLDRWFREELKEFMMDILLSKRAIERGYFKKRFIEKIIKEHLDFKWNWQYQIYNLLMLELWHREFIDK